MVNKFNSFENSDHFDEFDHSDDLDHSGDFDHSDDFDTFDRYDIFQRGLISGRFGHWRGDSTINNDSCSAKNIWYRNPH